MTLRTVWLLAVSLYACTRALPAPPPPVTCPAGAPIGNIDLRVVSPGRINALPLKTINRLDEGDVVLYTPILRKAEKRDGEVSLVLVPAKPESEDQDILVLDPKPAGKLIEWKIPRRVSVAAFLYGPDGLNQSKVRSMLKKNNELVSQLADYAEKTTQTEALIQALTATDRSPVSMDAAIQGFASQYGLSGRIDKSLPVDQQAMVLFRTVNPAMASYDPLASSGSQRVGQTASIATSIAGLFFGSPVGLAAGGTAMVMELRALAFPKTDFRSSFAETMPNDGLALCGKNDPAPAHTKIAYIWAARIPNVAPPTVTIGKANSIPDRLTSPLPVQVSDADWKYLDRVRSWRLVTDAKPPVPISVRKTGAERVLELDLSKASAVRPGTYRLEGDWDWDPFKVNGEVRISPISDFGTAQLDPLSQDQLISGKGKVRAVLTGSDFEFVTDVQFQKVNDAFSKPSPLPFVLPEGLRHGRQEHLDLLVDTKDLEPGPYRFLLKQVDGVTRPVHFEVLPPPASITDLPVVISRGELRREITLKGEHLDQITRLETPKGKIILGRALPQQSERTAVLEVTEGLKPGEALDMRAFISGHSEPLTFSNAIHVVGPHPSIVSAKLSPPAEAPIPIQPGELAAGVYVSGMLQVENLSASSAARISCEGQDGSAITLHMGEHSSSASLQQLGSDQVFLSFDSNAWPAGCILQVRIDNGPDGASAPCRLGRLVRLPQIEAFHIVGSETVSGEYAGELTGTDLQNIEKVGWDPNNGSAVADLPSPIPGAGMKQILRVRLPATEPALHAPLYIWLRGDENGRLTTIHN